MNMAAALLSSGAGQGVFGPEPAVKPEQIPAEKAIEQGQQAEDRHRQAYFPALPGDDHIARMVGKPYRTHRQKDGKGDIYRQPNHELVSCPASLVSSR
jgi:hypothetical protein